MLTDRQLRVLKAIINDFIESAQPVGSRTISRKYLVGTSPATIRNEMADLEELGYLFQPHTSAGRLPSDLGLRFFVDMLNFDELRLQTLKQLHSQFSDKVVEPVDIARIVAEKLSEHTDAIAVVSLPDFGKAKIENLKLIKVYRSKILMILVAGEGTVKYAEINSELEQDKLDEVANKLLEEFRGKTVEEISVKAMKAIDIEGMQYFIPLLKEALRTVKTSKMVVSGTHGLFKNQDVTSAEQVKSLLELIEADTQLDEMFRDILNESRYEIGIRIGTEFGVPELSNYAMMVTTFGCDSSSNGYIGIIGPKRMNYEENGELLQYFSKSLTTAFSGINL